MSENLDKLNMFYKKLDPTVAGLVGAGLGWMLSDTLVDTPRGRWTPQQEREWERVIEQASKRSRDRKLLSLLRRKDVDIEKNLMPSGKKVGYIPKKTGSISDPAKKRWTNPEASAASKPTGRVRRDAPVEPETTPDKMRPTMRAIVGNRRDDSKFPLIMSLAYTSQNIKKDLFSGSAKPAKDSTSKLNSLSKKRMFGLRPNRKKITRAMNDRTDAQGSTGQRERQSDKDIEKDRLSIPPRQGLVFDPAKKRWTNPDNVGKTVTEVQGRKRIRGTGTGVHEGAIATGKVGGKGEGSAVSGRKFRDAKEEEGQKPQKKKVSASALKRFMDNKKSAKKGSSKDKLKGRLAIRRN